MIRSKQITWNARSVGLDDGCSLSNVWIATWCSSCCHGNRSFRYKVVSIRTQTVKLHKSFKFFSEKEKKREEWIFVFFFLHILREFIFTGPNFHELLECPKRFHSARFSHPTVVLCLVKLMTITLLVVPYLICKWKQEVPWFWPSTPTVLQPTWTGNTYKTCSNDMTVV